MQTIINGIKINYEYLLRQKETIVFLHGWGGGIISFKGVYNFFEANTNYSLLNIDLPPFGESEEPPQTFTIYNYYSLVRNLLENLNIKNTHLVTHSFGGRIGLLLAAQNHSIIKTLTLVAAAGIKPYKSFKTTFKIVKYKLYKKFAKNKQKLENAGSRDYKNLSKNMKKVFVNIVNENLTKYLKNINCPTLIVWAKDDTETPMYMAKKFNRKIKNSGLVLYKTGGHFCYLKHHNNFVKTLKYFIDNGRNDL